MFQKTRKFYEINSHLLDLVQFLNRFDTFKKHLAITMIPQIKSEYQKHANKVLIRGIKIKFISRLRSKLLFASMWKISIFVYDS